jgi:hypothetical protein
VTDLFCWQIHPPVLAISGLHAWVWWHYNVLCEFCHIHKNETVYLGVQGWASSHQLSIDVFCLVFIVAHKNIKCVLSVGPHQLESHSLACLLPNPPSSLASNYVKRQFGWGIKLKRFLSCFLFCFHLDIRDICEVRKRHHQYPWSYTGWDL